MKRVLIINSSANINDSFSRRMSEHFLECLNKASSNTNIRFRDLAHEPIPHICEAWINADRKPRDSRCTEERDILRTSDILIKELHAADIVVLSTPMYNWSIPSNLKAYLDQVMRFSETFTTSEMVGKRYNGLLQNKILYLLLSRGSQGYGKGERNEYMDFQSRYLRMVFEIMGIGEIYEFTINGTKRNNEEFEREITAIQEQLATQLNTTFEQKIEPKRTKQL